ncbi:hypothetical protein MYSTI_05969 [Myxococcus stipitatus DSM 14675]|uniref:Lipoprotein n=1 Tax=Myxococcus stipitatus (strain DSM 14675 / JCM 12634 / Mx s8) TaxID=1278073 RepID=L7UI54_MYXSD|nr:hypothetical protein [Myxococcus stipitatus]AGC47242.1 hypothetical protein MYSTI_05969 [Myxococcus stipitatus DSM 14675]
MPAAGLVLHGCATPYQPMGMSGGYQDSEISPGVVRIEVRGNPYTHLGTLHDYFHKRAKELCKERQYQWFLDSGSEKGPQVFFGTQVGSAVILSDTTSNKRGWVRGVVTCRDTSEKTATPPPSQLVRILDVQSGLVTHVSSDLAMTQVPRSTRWAFVSEGKVRARTPEGHLVHVEVDKLDAARTLGYRLLSDAELETAAPPALSPTPDESSVAR